MITQTKITSALRSVFAVVLCAVLGGLLSSCTQASKSTTTPDSGYSFVIGVDQYFAPFAYRDENGELTGFDVELAAEVSKLYGWNFRVQPINWDAKDAELQSGTIQAIWNGFTVEGRESAYLFSESYMDNAQVVVVRSQDSSIQNLTDLATKNIEVQIDSTAEHLIRNQSGDKMLEFKRFDVVPDYLLALKDLEAGVTDAVIMDETAARFQIKGKESIFRILPENLAKEHYAVGCRLEDKELVAKINEGIRTLKDNGTFDRLYNKYFGR